MLRCAYAMSKHDYHMAYIHVDNVYLAFSWHTQPVVCAQFCRSQPLFNRLLVQVLCRVPFTRYNHRVAARAHAGSRSTVVTSKRIQPLKIACSVQPKLSELAGLLAVYTLHLIRFNPRRRCSAVGCCVWQDFLILALERTSGSAAATPAFAEHLQQVEQ
jgi:hypothetical protein